MNETVKNTIILTVITVIAGLFLGFVYDITKEPIRVQEEKTKQEAYLQVFPSAVKFEEDNSIDLANAPQVLENAGCKEAQIDEVLTAQDTSGTVLGYVMRVTTKEGYGGDISFSMGITKDGVLNGIEILSINETAGLGMKAKEDEFQNQFAGKQVAQFTYTKSGSTADYEIDAISGATITTNAMVNGVNAGLAYFASIDVNGGAASE